MLTELNETYAANILTLQAIEPEGSPPVREGDSEARQLYIAMLACCTSSKNYLSC